MTDRLPPPGPSFVREHAVHVHDRILEAGMGRPTDAPGGWWAALLWVAGTDGLVTFREIGPTAGPPPGPPTARLGPSLAGSLSGLVLEEAGRLQLKLAPVAPPADPARPWDVPLVVRLAIRFEPARAATMRANELADAVLAGFRRSVEALARP